MKYRYWGVAALAMSVLIIVAIGLVGCDKVGTPTQLHPTHAGPNGECVEWDEEPCDDDPFDNDDADIHLPKPTKKASPRPMLTARQPAPKTTKRR